LNPQPLEGLNLRSDKKWGVNVWGQNTFWCRCVKSYFVWAK